MTLSATVANDALSVKFPVKQVDTDDLVCLGLLWLLQYTEGAALTKC